MSTRPAGSESAAAAAELLIRRAVHEVEASRIETDLRALVNIGNRKAGTQGADQAVGYLCDRFSALNSPQAQTVLQEFPFMSGTTQQNVLYRPKSFTRRLLLVCAHYDSTSQPGLPAPGADDNASGIAAMLEVARILHGYRMDVDVVFAAFGAEEALQQGSKHSAKVAKCEAWPIDLVLNMDQIGFRGREPADQRVVEIQRDTERPPTSNNLPSLAYAMAMNTAARKYTWLEPRMTQLGTSDHLSFEEEGFACIGVFESGDNLAFHSDDDVLELVDIEYVTEVTRMVLATILTLGSPIAPSNADRPPV